MTWIKICGITNLEDALTAVDAGANALGFVFYDKSPRKVEPASVRDIIEHLPEHIGKALGGTGSGKVFARGADFAAAVKKGEVTIALVEDIPGEWRILEESAKHEAVNAFRARWEVTVPAEGSAKLTYSVRIKY